MLEPEFGQPNDDQIVLDKSNHPVATSFKRPREINGVDLLEHNVTTAGIREDRYINQLEHLSKQALTSFEMLLSFVSSTDSQLVTLAQLPTAHHVLTSFSNMVITKQREQNQQNNKRKRQDSLSYGSVPELISNVPYKQPNNTTTSTSTITSSSSASASAPNTPQMHITLPEGKLHANPCSLNIDWANSSINNFEVLGELGSGAFGTVRLCREKTTDVLFCVKILDRNRIRYLKQREHIINERTIMFSVNHPFIVKLFCTFKSPSCLFFIMEFIAGGELFNYIRAEGQFNNTTTKLVAAEIILALQYLHNQDIIYRDIKPENLLVDHQGHLKLTDFGFAKQIEDRTQSMCGTLDYMAPEILMSQGHGKAADWWSLGILIYEMLSGCPPLAADSTPGSHSMHLIAAGKLEYPSYFDPLATDLLQKMLVVDDKNRLGSRGGAEEVKNHPYFADINWESVIQRRKPGPLAGLKSFKLHIGTNLSNDYQYGDIDLRTELKNTGPSKTSSFEGFEGFRR